MFETLKVPSPALLIKAGCLIPKPIMEGYVIWSLNLLLFPQCYNLISG